MINMGLHPFDEIRFYHELAPADLHGWKVRLAHQCVGTGLGNAQSLSQKLCIQYVRQIFK